MTRDSDKLSDLDSSGAWLSADRLRGAAAVLLALSPPIVCAFLAKNSGRWDLFERSGSITTAVGLFLASRRYIRYGALELAMLHADKVPRDVTEIFEEIFTAKSALALSAFGTIVWGWGTYLRWWSFGFLLVWALFVVRDACRDSNKATHLGLH